MFSEQHHFRVANPASDTAVSPALSDKARKTKMNLKKLIRAAIIWVSEKLPCTGPQFQIINNNDSDPEDEG